MAEQKTVEEVMEVGGDAVRRMGLSMHQFGQAMDLMSSRIRETVAPTLMRMAESLRTRAVSTPRINMARANVLDELSAYIRARFATVTAEHPNIRLIEVRYEQDLRMMSYIFEVRMRLGHEQDYVYGHHVSQQELEQRDHARVAAYCQHIGDTIVESCVASILQQYQPDPEVARINLVADIASMQAHAMTRALDREILDGMSAHERQEAQMLMAEQERRLVPPRPHVLSTTFDRRTMIGTEHLLTNRLIALGMVLDKLDIRPHLTMRTMVARVLASTPKNPTSWKEVSVEVDEDEVVDGEHSLDSERTVYLVLDRLEEKLWEEFGPKAETPADRYAKVRVIHFRKEKRCG